MKIGIINQCGSGEQMKLNNRKEFNFLGYTKCIKTCKIPLKSTIKWIQMRKWEMWIRKNLNAMKIWRRVEVFEFGALFSAVQLSQASACSSSLNT